MSHCFRNFLITAVAGAAIPLAGAGAASPVPTPKPKYGPQAQVLSLSHQYFRRAPAPDFWALIPYYVPQQDESSCSVASVSMIVNGARVGEKLSADDKLATQAGLISRVKNKAWHKSVMAGAMAGNYGVNLDQLAEVAREALEAYGVHPRSIEVVHTDSDSPQVKAKLHQALVENEKSARDFILINFNQQVYTGDADVGHIAPIGAYDALHHKVLVLDPDREWYEPYWVSEDTLLAGMNTEDRSSGRHRGYVWIKLR